jgi:glycosyltransferase involved in cell wall biosynthesis
MPQAIETRVREKISAIVTTFNEEREIADCIRSLLWCDEILIVDSFSTDGTVEIGRSFPANVRLLQHTYFGSAAQKNWAMDRTSHEWILIFDADERCTPELRAEIEALLERGAEHSSYSIRRRLFFLDKHIRFSGFQRDVVVRLIRRGCGRYPNRRVHADMMTLGAAPKLANPMDHYMVRDLSEYVHRISKYGVWGAAQGWRDNRKSGILQVIGRPGWRFLRTYVFQLGFLDGFHGLVFCSLQAFGTFLKWAILWGWRVTGTPRLPEFDESAETWQLLDQQPSES